MIGGAVHSRVYRDSIELMAIAAALERFPGVHRAALLLALPANLELLSGAGLAFDAASRAAPDDLLLAVEAATTDAADAALAHAAELLRGLPSDGAAATAAVPAPRSLEAALQQQPDATLAVISVPGPFAAAEALKALQGGLDVFLFSDNVSLADEVALKRRAATSGRLLMGPDCGTAILNGLPLGFANVVRRGAIGLVSASGTGLQEVTCLIDRLGGGVSQAIGVGGRDLSEAVGGLSMLAAVARLADDTATQTIVLVSKPPAPSVAGRVLAAAVETGKPVIACFIGADRFPAPAGVRIVATLEAAAAAAVGADGVSSAAAHDRPVGEPGGYLRGLFAGGTLAYEARMLASKRLGEIAFVEAGTPRDVTGHAIVDLGADAFTRGRAHPMLDPRLRGEWVRALAEDAVTGVLLFDLVLGHGSHPDPAGALVPALARVRCPMVASVCGTDADPQSLTTQEAKLRDAGVTVARSNAAAARLAASLAAP